MNRGSGITNPISVPVPIPIGIAIIAVVSGNWVRASPTAGSPECRSRGRVAIAAGRVVVVGNARAATARRRNAIDADLRNEMIDR